MSERNSLLIVGLYTTIAVLVVIIGYGTFAYYDAASAGAVARLEATLAAEAAAQGRPAVTQPRVSPVNAAALTRAHAKLNELQAMLQRNSRLLEKRTSLLNQKTSECKSLQEQLDGSIATALELLGTDPDAGDSEARRKLGRDLEQEFMQLKAELERSEALELEQAEQVEELKSELMETEAEIAAIREQANAELLSLLDQQQLVEAASRRAFRQLGATAVPVLVELLNDDRAEVRTWAAAVLGNLGTDGQDAVPALMGMLVDNDQGVRDQAKRSLDLLAN